MMMTRRWPLSDSWQQHGLEFWQQWISLRPRVTGGEQLQPSAGQINAAGGGGLRHHINPGDIQSKHWLRKHKCPVQPSVQAPVLRCDASATNCDRRTCVLSVIKGNENWESDNSRFCYCYTAAGRKSLYKSDSLVVSIHSSSWTTISSS